MGVVIEIGLPLVPNRSREQARKRVSRKQANGFSDETDLMLTLQNEKNLSFFFGGCIFCFLE